MKLIKNIKTWWQVASPSVPIWIFQFLFALIPSICTILSSIPNAKAITSLLVYDQNSTIKYLSISLALSIIYAISWHIQYRLDTAQLKHIYPKIQKQVFDKIFIADDINFVENSTEKMINILSNDITELSDFCDYSSTKFACLVEFIIILCIIFSYHILVGALMVVLALIVFLMIKLASRLIAKKDFLLLEERDKLSETFSDIVKNRAMGQDFNLKTSLEKSYFDKVENVLTLYKKRTGLKSLRDNFVYIFYTLIVFVFTIYLTKLTIANTLTTTLYLVLVPYLTSSIQKVVCFCNISSDIESCAISATRVKTILSMSTKDIIAFGENQAFDTNGAITFTSVSYNAQTKQDPTVGSINCFSAQISKNQIALFQGERNCGKRAIFYMLRRAIRPDTGTITLGIINIFDISKNAYISNLAYVTSKPNFYSKTIIQNFKLISQSKTKIISACKLAQIHQKIMQMPNTYQSSFNQSKNLFSPFEKFQLSLARAILTNSKIIAIYEFPAGMNETETQTLENILLTLKQHKTIIIFSAKNLFPKIIDKHFTIVKGTLTEQPSSKTINQKNIKISSVFSK